MYTHKNPLPLSLSQIELLNIDTSLINEDILPFKIQAPFFYMLLACIFRTIFTVHEAILPEFRDKEWTKSSFKIKAPKIYRIYTCKGEIFKYNSFSIHKSKKNTHENPYCDVLLQVCSWNKHSAVTEFTSGFCFWVGFSFFNLRIGIVKYIYKNDSETKRKWN